MVAKTKKKKQTKNKKEKTIQIAKDWNKPAIQEYNRKYLEDYYDNLQNFLPEEGGFLGEDGPPIPIDEFAKGSSAKKKTKKKRPRGVGIASRGYGKAMR